MEKNMLINIIAKSGISILAVAVVVTMVNGIAQNSQSIINTAMDMFWGVIITIILVTVVINLPRILRVL
jgi:hypothetical protein